MTVYRADQAFALNAVIPRPGDHPGPFDLVIASQPYRAQATVTFKTQEILAPLARVLAPGGRLIAIQSRGDDPGSELIGRIWPDRRPFPHDRHVILDGLKAALRGEARDFRFAAYGDRQSLFRYDLHMLPGEVGGRVGTSTLFAAWNAATYVAQIEDPLIEDAMRRADIMDITREVLHHHGGMWFFDESFVVSRR
jgi:SAM-dependent methyltransferase